ncbi:DUF4276 family protein [candidate division KSB1 bacterium]|nr:DUF4276 family protein [candidate division KSB1 bacterium]
MTNLVFLLEELSAEALLKVLMRRMIVQKENIFVRYIVFEGKQDLEKKLARKLRGWKLPNSKFIVLRDQDSADCKIVKFKLLKLCPEDKKPHTLVRIACHELESWYLGDLNAVEHGLELSGIAKYQEKKRYRIPDSIQAPADALERLTNRIYQKISGSRAIGEYLNLDNTRSISFNVFITGIKNILAI